MNGNNASGLQTISAMGATKSPPLLKRTLEDSLSMIVKGPRGSDRSGTLNSKFKPGLSPTSQIRFKKKPSAEGSQQLIGKMKADLSVSSKQYQSQVEIGISKQPTLL